MKITKLLLASLAGATVLSGCVTNDQGQLVMDPNVSALIATAVTPPPPPPPAAPVVVEEAYEPMPGDAYVATVVDQDVVVVGGSTYIWVVGPDGVRHRQFYAHGDHRADVFHRRDELHSVMAHHSGHLPDHAIAAAHGQGPGARGPLTPTQMHRGPGMPAAAHAAIPAKPAPAAAPASKQTKKS